MNAQEIRDVFDDVLRVHVNNGGGMQLAEQVRDTAKRSGATIDTDFWRAVTEHFWTLARAGVLAIMPRDRTAIPMEVPQEERHIPTFFITELGKRVLREPSVSPHDWVKYQATIQLRVGAPDDIVMIHLGEAVQAWLSGLNRASAVMLGCAVERLIIILAEVMRDASLPAPADRLKDMLKNPRVGISELYDVVHDVLDGLTEDKKLPGALADAWERRLTPAFEHTRALRNRSGHPTGTAVSNDDAHSGLLLFPGLYEFVDKLIQAVRALAAPAAAAAT